MHLKNLTVLGFKSFADKTALNFEPGVTGIVGPNGCGKSNVSDAIRWVLGEQSAKALRGGEMADVIFNGTEKRKPLGMAEVSLTIGGVDREHLRAAGVELEYDEVTVTRRVFRDGGSEYFVNKAPCRLKDIQQLFMGTGVGRTSYSIMAQGNITQILSSKPEDRRLVFEEAAGITKYKSQKKEALRKLDTTEQNLLRVADLVREVKRQIGSLQRQAGKARRYKQLAMELQHLDTQHARHQYDVLAGEIQERQATADSCRDQIESRSEAVLRFEDEIGQLRETASQLEHQVAALQQQGLELKGQIDRHESRIHFNEERLRELASHNAAAMAEMTQAEERRRAAEEDLNAVRGQLESSMNALQEHRQALASKQEGLSQLEQELRRQQEELRKAQSQAFAAAQDLSRVRNEINALDLQKQGNVARLEKLSAEKIELEAERARLESRLQDFAANVQAEKLDAQTQRGTVQERQSRLAQVQEESGRVGGELDQLWQRQAEQRSRLNVLEQLQSEHEGFSAGALAALKQSQHVLGSLVDKIRVPDQYIMAIEAALGHHLQLVLTEHPESAQQILADLSAGRKGKASIAPLTFISTGNGSGSLNGGNQNQIFGSETGNGEHYATAPSNGGPGESARFSAPAMSSMPVPVELNGVPLEAMRVVEGEVSFRNLLERLLGSTRIVRDLEAATSAWRGSEGCLDYVTVSGEILSRYGVYTGGAQNGAGDGRSSSMLGRKNQIGELQAALVQLQEHAAELSRQKGALQSEQTELQASLQQAQTQLRAQEVAIATHEGEYNALRGSQRLLAQKVETVVYEIQSLAAHDQEGAERRAALASKASELEEHEQTHQSRVSEVTALLESLRQQREARNASLTESKVGLATQEQMCAAHQQQKQSLERRLGELSQLIEQRRSEMSSFVARKEQAESEIQDSGREIERLRHEREQVNAQTAELVSQQRAQEAEVASREEALREERRRLSDIQQQRGALEVELAQKNMAVQNLRERIQQKYHVNLEDIRSECITITFADEGPARVHVLSPDEMAAAGVATDWTVVAQQVEGLQQRLDEMGPVNLVAIEEYEETEQRYQFLSKQHDDLVQAKAQLLEVINRINTQTQEMFRQTFEQIRQNFQTMFVEVFGGGKADLVLTDANDLLESGIDIVARPPGKQLQTISLLSGGEQTMTAVSLLFSIYQVRPSPFCVLDELDAPLDESNINRFLHILKRFLEHSQFIIITHNKRTIGMADVLYGVTMQEHGVSRIVSVRFHKADEEEGPETENPRPSRASVLESSTATPAETEEVMMAK